MANKRLKNLIRASGSAGTAGQSFDVHVPGSGAASRMSDYHLHSWLDWSSPNHAHDDIGHSLIFDDNTVLDFVFDISAGSHFGHIKGGLGDFSLEIEGADPSGAEFSSIESLTWGAGFPLDNEVAVRLRGKWRFGAGIQITKNWFHDLSPPAQPPNNDDYEWHIDAARNAPDLSGSDHYEFTIRYTPPQANVADGEWNDSLTKTYPVDVRPRSGGSLPLLVEWHDNDTYTSLVSSDASLQFMSGASYHYNQFWMRYRASSGDSWTNYPFIITHDDPRFANPP